MRRALAVVAVWGSFLGGGCGGGASTQPTSPTARAAEVDPRVVVVWSAEHLSALESALERGPVLVRVDGGHTTVLGQCRLTGQALERATYAYAATALRRAQVSLQNRAAARAQLPEMADTLFAAFAPELGRGDAVDIDLVSVGKRTLMDAPATLHRGGVEGGDECAGATHLVTGTTVGAFDIATTAAKSGGPTRQIKSGNLALCGDARAAQCSNPLMLELLAISP